MQDELASTAFLAVTCIGVGCPVISSDAISIKSKPLSRGSHPDLRTLYRRLRSLLVSSSDVQYRASRPLGDRFTRSKMTRASASHTNERDMDRRTLPQEEIDQRVVCYVGSRIGVDISELCKVRFPNR